MRILILTMIVMTLALPVGALPEASSLAPAARPAAERLHADAYQAPDTGPGRQAPGNVVDTTAPFGDPLLRAHPDAWAATLAATGSLPEAVEAARSELGEATALLPLDDINGDGHGDYLVYTLSLQDDGTPSERLEATSGRDGSILWTHALPEHSYFYFVDDVDGDGLWDLVVVTQQEDGTVSGTGAAILFHMEGHMEFDLEIVVVTTRSGGELFSTATQGIFEFEWLGASAVVAAATLSHYAISYPFMMAVPGPGDHGIDLVQIDLESRTSNAYALVAWAIGGQYAMAFQVQRLAPDGTIRWQTSVAYDGLQSGGLMDVRDFTGDGIPDLLFSTLGSNLYAGGTAGWVEPPVDELEVTLVDGATGNVLWRHNEDLQPGLGVALPGAALDGSGARTINMVQIDFGPLDSGTRLTVLDGADGTILDSTEFPGTIFLPFPFADADGDGSENLMVLRGPINAFTSTGSIELAVVRAADHTDVWTKNLDQTWPMFDPISGYGMADLTGDGVPDLPFWDRSGQDRMEFVGGADGIPLWSVAWNDDLQGVYLLTDLDGGGGHDVALMRHDGARSGSLEGPTRLEVVRGLDGQRMWHKAVYDPAQGEPEGSDVEAQVEWAFAASQPDVNGNGVDDLLVSIAVWHRGEADLNDGAPRLTSVAYVLEGSDGRALAVHPGGRITGPEPPPGIPPGAVGASTAPAELGPAAPRPQEVELEGRTIPGPASVAPLLLLGCAALWLRRRN